MRKCSIEKSRWDSERDETERKKNLFNFNNNNNNKKFQWVNNIRKIPFQKNKNLASLELIDVIFYGYQTKRSIQSDDWPSTYSRFKAVAAQCPHRECPDGHRCVNEYQNSHSKTTKEPHHDWEDDNRVLLPRSVYETAIFVIYNNQLLTV